MAHELQRAGHPDCDHPARQLALRVAEHASKCPESAPRRVGQKRQSEDASAEYCPRSLSTLELGVPKDRLQSAVAYRDFHPGAPLSATPGSDGFVGAILRDFARVGRPPSDATWIAPDATLDDLRSRRCRSITLVTDFVGSGNQALRLAQAIARNPTIRSWRSLHLVDIRVVAFAAHPDTLDYLLSPEGDRRHRRC